MQRTRCPVSGKIITKQDQQVLLQVLLGINFVIPDMGYCQGMNYVASSLFIETKDEELTFNFMLSLLVQKELKPLYSNNVPEYHVRQFMLD